MIDRVMIMKKILGKWPEALGITGLAAALWYCTARSAEVRSAASLGMERCTEVIIPSLYAMIAVSAMLTSSGLVGRMPGGRIAVFLFSQTAGYPAGAAILTGEYRRGRLSKRGAELLMGVCFGAGPAFVQGCVSAGLYGSSRAGRVILVSNVTANTLVGAVTAVLIKREAKVSTDRPLLRIDADVLTESVAAAGRSIAGICFMVVAFAVFTAMLRDLGAIGAAGRVISLTGADCPEGIAEALLDVTAVSELPCGNYRLLPWISGLVSFGGICVIMQIASLTRGELSVRPLIVMRTVSAAASWWICRGLMPIMLAEETVSAAAFRKLHKSTSPVPSVMLILMTAVLMCEIQSPKNEKISK